MIVRSERLSVRFRTGFGRRAVRALDGVDLEVAEGDFFALLGPNGAGKSTLMYCLLGLVRPTSGTVTVLGRTPEVGSTVYGRIAYLPEEPHYHDYLTVEEAVVYYGSLFGPRVTRETVQSLLERLGLAEFARLRLGRCSKGMKQKVGIAQCLLNEPRLLFLDEPMRGLDPVAVRQFRDILLEMNRRGATIVMSSHILAEVEQVANRVAILDHGRVVAQDAVANLVRVEKDVYVVELETAGDLPDGFERRPAAGPAIVGEVPAARLHDFFQSAQRVGATILSCNRRRSTLEDSFLRVLSGDARDA